MKNKIAIPIFIAVLVFTAVPTVALAGMLYNFTFRCITNNNAGDCQIGQDQLMLQVTDIAQGVKFNFINMDGPESEASSITDIYFDDPTLSSGLTSSFLNYASAAIQPPTTEVAFSPNASPPDLPGGSPIGFSADYSADSDPPAQPLGVNPGESVYIDIKFTETAKTSVDLAAAIASGSLNIGIHVQGFGTGGSEAFIIRYSPSEGPIPIPEPATMLLLGTGLAGVAGAAKRRRKKLQQ